MEKKKKEPPMVAILWKNRKLAMTLAKDDFKKKFAGSYLGIIWAFVQPVITILVYWFIFEVIGKSGETMKIPFVLYLVVGIIPWFFFSDSLASGTMCLIEYAFLVKKVVFRIDILPLVKILSAMFVHMFFIAFSMILLCFYGIYPGPQAIQVVYYVFCTLVLVLAILYTTSAITVFFRDLSQIIAIFVLQVGIWLTPIMWDAEARLAAHPTIIKVLKLNPMYYVVSGFRDALLYKKWVWEKPFWTLYFWGMTLILFLIGVGIFRKLRVHFADVL